MNPRSPPKPSEVEEEPLPAAIRDLAARGIERRYRKGAVLIEEGDQGESLYVILAGRVKVFVTGPKGREMTLAIYGPGEYVGEMSLDGGPRSATVETLEATRCSVISRAQLLAHIGERPEFAFELLARVIRRARMATEDVRSLALIDVYGRLARLLESLAVVQADGRRGISSWLTHLEISKRVGCSREMVSRLLKDLENGGYIRIVQRRIELVRPLPERW